MKTLMNLKNLLTLTFICFAYFATAQSTTSYGAQAATAGSNCTFIGYQAGKSIASYTCCNTFLGAKAGRDNTTADANTFIGQSAGERNQTGRRNTYLGLRTGQLNTTGEWNTFLGAYSGGLSEGSYNVFVGYSAGLNEKGSHKLYIDNSKTTTPLIYGDFASNQVGINTGDNVPAGYALAIKGKTITEEVKVRTYNNWPDYVFDTDYQLTPLNTLEAEIKEEGHLPGVPSAQEVAEDGFNLGEMDALLLEKVEELTLYLIDVNKKVEKLETENKALKEELKQIKK